MGSYLYQYLVGGLVFVAGLLVGLRSGQLGWVRGAPRRRLLLLLLGLLWFALLQGLLLVWSR